MVPDYIVTEDLWDNKASTAWIRSLKKAQAWSVGLFSDASYHHQLKQPASKWFSTNCLERADTQQFFPANLMEIRKIQKKEHLEHPLGMYEWGVEEIQMELSAWSELYEASLSAPDTKY